MVEVKSNALRTTDFRIFYSIHTEMIRFLETVYHASIPDQSIQGVNQFFDESQLSSQEIMELCNSARDFFGKYFLNYYILGPQAIIITNDFKYINHYDSPECFKQFQHLCTKMIGLERWVMGDPFLADIYEAERRCGDSFFNVKNMDLEGVFKRQDMYSPADRQTLQEAIDKDFLGDLDAVFSLRTNDYLMRSFDGQIKGNEFDFACIKWRHTEYLTQLGYV